MASEGLKAQRELRGWSQAQAAVRLGVSQPYLAMLENGRRRLTPKLARRVVEVYGLSASMLPPLEGVRYGETGAEELAKDLAVLGYPGFSYLRPHHARPRNPAEVLLAALAEEQLEARVVEALPWLVLRYSPLDHTWLVQEAKLRDLQNRLGFVVTLARRVAERKQDDDKANTLRALETELERSRLAREDTLCKVLREPQRRWLALNRSEDAKHWNLLTDWTPDVLRYVA